MGVPDLDLVNIALTAGGAPDSAETVFRVTNCGATGGWYYDDPVAPQMINLCPSTCQHQQDWGLDVEVLLGCDTQNINEACGNGTVDTNIGEQCDGANLNGETCLSQGYTGGTLTCDASCALNLSGCVN